MSELVARIDDAFTRPEPGDAIRLVKEAVHDELRGLDPEVGLATTGFFNHVFRPDFLLSWHERGERRERPLYLRFEVGGGLLRDDPGLQNADSPLFVGLLDHRPPPEGGEPVADWGGEGAPRDTLIAEASAIDTLEDFAREEPEHLAATSALVRGGAGRLDAEAANALSPALSQGFASAAEGTDPEPVFVAFGLLERLIDRPYADQFATHMQLLWLASGGDLDDLFGVEQLDVGSLSDLQLRQVLEQVLSREEPPEGVTLRRLGQALTPDRLGKLLRNFEGGHLGRLIDVNLSAWQTNLAQVHSRGTPAHGWRLTNELVTLDAGSATLIVTERGHKLGRRHEGEPLPRTEFLARMDSDLAIELDLVSEDAELVLRRRADAEGSPEVSTAQIDALGELAAYVLRARVESTVPGRTAEGGQSGVEISYSRGTIKVDEPVPLRRLINLANRYFGLTERPSGKT